MGWDIVYRPLTSSSGDDPPDYGWLLTTSNTGLARLGINGDDLPVYSGSATPTAGTTISLQKITYSELICKNGNITIDRCLIQPTAAGGRSSIVFGYEPDVGTGTQLGNVTITDCDIDGSLCAANMSLWTACAFRGAGTVQRCRIWGMGTGIAYFHSSAVSTAVIEHNYVYGLRGGGTVPNDSHNESATVRSFSGSSLIWRKNRLVSDSGHDSGSMFIQTYDGNIQNVSLQDNWFDCAGDWDLYVENYSGGGSYSNLSATNNRFGTSGGTVAVNNGVGFTSWSSNYRYDASNPPTYAGAEVNA